MANNPSNGNVAQLSIREEGLIAETLYDPTTNKTSFAIASDGKYGEDDIVTTSDNIITPISKEHYLIKYDLVKFPSEMVEYGSKEALYKEIKAFIHKYMDVDEYFESLTAVYIMMTWIYDKFYEIPYLRVKGTYGSGKSRFLDTVGALCYKPLSTSGANSESSFFRTMDVVRGSLILDEANFRYTGRETLLVKMLNDGNKRGGTVTRMKTLRDGGFEPEVFNVFCPKVIASISDYTDDAFESRCISYLLGKKNIREDIPEQLPDAFWDEALKIRNKLLTYRLMNMQMPKEEVEWLDVNVQPRIKQIAIPLLKTLNIDEVRDNLLLFITRHDEQLREAERMTDAFDVFSSILELQSEDREKLYTIGEITEKYNFSSCEASITPNVVGRIIRTQLGLETKKRASGFVLLKTRRNTERIEFLKERFDIDDSEYDSAPDAPNAPEEDTAISEEGL